MSLCRLRNRAAAQSWEAVASATPRSTGKLRSPSEGHQPMIALEMQRA